MTAKEMFEKLGYNKVENNFDITFQTDLNGDLDYLIIFDLRNKYYMAFEYMGVLKVDCETHKAITQQMKELGWIE